MSVISKGQRTQLSAFVDNIDNFQIGISIISSNITIDFACFGLNSEQKLSDDAYMTFFNQPKTPCGAVELSVPFGDSAGFMCYLSRLPEKIDRLVFTAAIDGEGTMGQIEQGYLRFMKGNQETATYLFSGADFKDEKAIMIGEIYRKECSWRFNAIGQGFNGGMAALVKHFGGEVIDDQPAPAKTKISLEKKLGENASPKLISLAKKATISLEKHRLVDTVARVGLVLDASGSMSKQYRTGKVQSVIDRLLPLVVHFDDDGELDVWAFSKNVLALPPATLNNYSNFIDTVENGWNRWGMMSINNEPAVIEQLVAYYKNTKLPVLVVFVSDGGVNQNVKIKQLLTSASNLPIFWQFVGIGGNNYGVLEKLDTMTGRLVDNCGFFALDDLDSVSEQELYDRLLSEFPVWLREAKKLSIL